MTSHQVFHGVAPSFEQDALVLNTETKTATVVGKISVFQSQGPQPLTGSLFRHVFMHPKAAPLLARQCNIK